MNDCYAHVYYMEMIYLLVRDIIDNTDYVSGTQELEEGIDHRIIST